MILPALYFYNLLYFVQTFFHVWWPLNFPLILVKKLTANNSLLMHILLNFWCFGVIVFFNFFLTGCLLYFVHILFRRWVNSQNVLLRSIFWFTGFVDFWVNITFFWPSTYNFFFVYRFYQVFTWNSKIILKIKFIVF